MAAAPQQSGSPVLHRRSEKLPEDFSTVVINEHARNLLPAGASGEYKLGDEGQVIQVTDQFGQLSGYLSRRSDAEIDDGKILTWFFNRASGNQQRLSFTTRQVHGVWYSFEGGITRGPSRTRAEDGYYLLEGDLIAHDEARKLIQRRSVSLKLVGQG